MQPPVSPNLVNTNLGWLNGCFGCKGGVSGGQSVACTLRVGDVALWRRVCLVGRHHHGDYGDSQVHPQHVVEHEAKDDHNVEYLATGEPICNTSRSHAAG